MPQNAIYTACDKKYGDFLIDHWYRSLRDHTDLTQTEVRVLDYGLSTAQKYYLAHEGAVVVPCRRDGHPAVIRFRDMAEDLGRRPVDQVLACDGGDIIFQADLSPLFALDPGEFRAVDEDLHSGFDAFLTEEFFTKADQKFLQEVLAGKPQINAGLVVGPADRFLDLCRRVERMVRRQDKFGPDQLVVNGVLHSQGYRARGVTRPARRGTPARVQSPTEEPMQSMGLVLEGGALRGQYTAGVLDAFLEAGVAFPYVIGVSAGASIACSFVSKQHGRNKVIVDTYRHDKRYLSLRNLVTTGSLFGMDFIYGDVPRTLVPFDHATFDASPTRFVTVCTDCVTGEAVYYEKEGEDHLAVLRASASMPFLSPMVEYRGRLLLDGALADSLPLARAVAEGFAKNVVVLTRPAGYRKKAPNPWPARLAYAQFPQTVEAINGRWRQYNASLGAIEAAEAAGSALVIRPTADLKIGRTEKSLAKLTELYELGRLDGKAALGDKRFFG